MRKILIFGITALCLYIIFHALFSKKGSHTKYESLTLPPLDEQTLTTRVKEGERLFQQTGCIECHNFQGKGVKEGISLDLVLKSMDAGLTKRWIRYPQMVKAGVKMPTSFLSQDQILSMLYYLYESQNTSYQQSQTPS